MGHGSKDRHKRLCLGLPVFGAGGTALARLGASAAAAAEGLVDRADDLLATELCPVFLEPDMMPKEAKALAKRLGEIPESFSAIFYRNGERLNYMFLATDGAELSCPGTTRGVRRRGRRRPR